MIVIDASVLAPALSDRANEMAWRLGPRYRHVQTEVRHLFNVRGYAKGAIKHALYWSCFRREYQVTTRRYRISIQNFRRAATQS